MYRKDPIFSNLYIIAFAYSVRGYLFPEKRFFLERTYSYCTLIPPPSQMYDLPWIERFPELETDHKVIIIYNDSDYHK